MPRRRLEDKQVDFTGGLTLDLFAYPTVDLSAIPKNALLTATHCRLTQEGGLRKLLGSRRLHSAAIDSGVRINGGFSWRRGSGTVQQLATTDQLFTGTYAVPMTWTAQTGALDNTTRHDFASFRDGSGEAVYIADGGPLNKWDGTNVTVNIASTPSVSRIAVYNQRLFGISGNNETLYWSGLNNGDTLGIAASGGGTANVRTYGAQNLTAIVPIEGTLLLFHAGAISRFSGYSQDDIDIDAGVIGHAAGVGTLAPRSIVVIDIGGQDAALFLAKKGLYIASETGVVPIPTPFDSSLAEIGVSAWSDIHAVHNPLKSEVWFVIPGWGAYLYNYFHKAWTGPGTPFSIDSFGTPVAGGSSALWTALDDLGGQVVLSGGYDGFVRRYDQPDTSLHDLLSDGSGGTTFPTTITFAPWFFGDESLEKSLRHLYITAQADTTPVEVTVSWVTRHDVVAETTTATIDTNYKTIAIPWWGRGTWVHVTILDDGEKPTLYGPIRGEAFAMGRRR